MSIIQWQLGQPHLSTIPETEGRVNNCHTHTITIHHLLHLVYAALQSILRRAVLLMAAWKKQLQICKCSMH